ncbi:MAG TPA: IPT/TIG domain-containing protein [Kofleriaceae bacterium]|nr:IPT/TIG domain-containing protein [Kofleriaceae bacterium]
MTRFALFAAALAACSAPSTRLDRVTPDYGPLAGGTQITLEGDQFPSDARVFIGDREAPLAAVSRDGTKLDVVIPPGDRPGSAPLVVIANDDVASSPDGFRYTTEPTIVSVSDDRVIPARGTILTLAGSGFADDGAGAVTILVDGVPATSVFVESDTEVAFTVPDGQLLVQPTIQLINDRGTASLDRAFRFVPTRNPSLVLFPSYTNELAEVFDLVSKATFSVPRPTPLVYRYSSAYVDGRGDYWAVDRAAHFGRLDMRTGQIVNPASLSTSLPAITRYGSSVLAIDRGSIGTIDPSAGVYYHTFTTPIGCCGGFGIAADGDTLYVTSRATNTVVLRTFDTQTGSFSAPVSLTAGTAFWPEELRVIDHVLYATSRDNTLCTIDPTTGLVTVLATIQRANAFDRLP